MADQRVQRSRATVLRTTFDLLTETGLGGLTIDEVSRRSGVAKTTIYRHWPTRSELIIDACAGMEADLTVPDSGAVRADVLALVTEIAGRMESARWASVLPSIVDAAERDPELATLHSRIQRGHMGPLRAVLERAVAAGALPPQTDVSVLVPALIGPVYYRRWFSREPLDPAFLAAVVDTALGSAG